MASTEGISQSALDRLQSELCITIESLEAMPDETLHRALLKLEIPNRPQLRIEHRLLGMRNDHGEIPDGAEQRAHNQLEQMRAEVPQQRVLRGGVPVGAAPRPLTMTAAAPEPGLSPANAGWTGLGPGNIGGRTRAMLIDPADSSRIWAGSVGGGVWITDDNGGHWRPVDDLMGNLAVCSLAMHPTNHQIIYAGTGEGFGNVDAIRGAGIFKTTDGGASWHVLEATSPDQPPPNPVNTNFYYVNRLVMSGDGAVIVAGTQTGIFRSTDDGESWSQVLNNARIGRVAFSPGDDNNLIASGNSGDGRVFYSNDGGVTWTQGARASAGTGRVDLAYARQNASIIYASVQATPSELWKSTDGGKSYVKQQAKLVNGSAANFLGQQGWYDNIIWAGDPTNANLVIVGGIDLFRSTDGGNTFTQISTWWNSLSAHADHHIITEDPGYDGVNNKKAWFGNDGGVYWTNDITTVGNNAGPPYTNGWVNKNTEYEVTQFYAVASNVATKTAIGGAQDNGTLRYVPAAGPNNWNSLYGGDGGYVASDPADPSVYYGEYVTLQLFRNTNSGASGAGSAYICGRYWDGSRWSWKPVPYSIPDAQNGNALFIAPFTMDPKKSDRLLAGGRSLWRTNDAKTANTPATGPGWSSIKDSIGGANISAITIGHSDSDLVYVGYVNGRIDKSTDATQNTPTWSNVGTAIGAARMCTCVAIDPKSSDVVYATFGGYQSGNVWKSTDGGNNWINIGESLPDVPVRWVAVHPAESQYIYLGTEVGVFVSEDAGAHWSPTNEGPTDCCVYQLGWMGATLLCATHGRGIFQIDLTIHNTASTVVVGDSAGEVYALNGQTGTGGSKFNAGGNVSSAALVVDDALYLGAGTTVYRRNSDTLNQVWSKVIGNGPIDASPALDVAGPSPDDDTLYVGTSAGWLYAFVPTDGTEKWGLNVLNLPAGTRKKLVSTQIMNRWAYLSGEAGTQAIDLYKADQHHVDPTVNPVGWTDSMASNHPVLLAAASVFVPGDSGSLLRLDARGGDHIWEYQPGSQITTAPVWMLGGICFGDSDGNLVVVNFRNGHPLAQKSFMGETIEALIADGQILYVVTSGNNGTLSAWNVQVQVTGWAMTKAWSIALPGGVSQAPSIVGSTLYATANTGVIYAYNIAEQVVGNRQIWQYAAANPAVATPSPVFA